MAGLFPPFDPETNEARPRRFRAVPMRVLIPNVITLLAICIGLTAIRMGIEGRMELAIYAVVVAAVLDGLDGRLARLLQGTSRFGAELDSLCDFVNFGVVPALLLYIWTLHDLGSIGWVGAIIFAIAAVLRLARFNVALDHPKPAFAQDFFVGVPAPAGALLVLLPIYLGQLGLTEPTRAGAVVSLIYCVAIGLLMVSQFPTWSFKKSAARVPREHVAPVFVGAVIFIALLVSYTWEMLAFGSLFYLATIPFAWVSWRRLSRLHGSAELTGDAPPEATAPPGEDAAAEESPRIR